MTRQTTPDYTSICPVCKKEITLIRRAGWFRRHMQAKGQICPGSWHTPNELLAAEKEIDAWPSANGYYLQEDDDDDD